MLDLIPLIDLFDGLPLLQAVGTHKLFMKSGNSHTGGTYLIVCAALHHAWLPKDGPVTEATKFMAKLLRNCLDVWVSMRTALNMEEAQYMCLKEKQMGTVGRTRMTLLEWRIAFLRSVNRVVLAQAQGRRTPAQLLDQAIDAHQKKERNAKLRMHTDEVTALKNFAAWPEEVWRVFEGAFARSAQKVSCWPVTVLKWAQFAPGAPLDCPPANALWVEIMTPNACKQMLFAHRKDRAFNKQAVAVCPQADFPDSVLWRMAFLFSHSVTISDAKKVKTEGELELAKYQFIDGVYDALTSAHAREQYYAIDFMGLPWLGGDCSEVGGSGSSGVFGASEQDLKKLMSEKLGSDLDSYKKTVHMEKVKFTRAEQEGQELQGKRKDVMMSQRQEQEIQLLTAAGRYKSKLQVAGHKIELALNTYLDQCLTDAIEAKPKIAPAQLLVTKIIVLDQLGQTWSSSFNDIHEAIVNFCATHKLGGQLLLLAPTKPMYGSGDCKTEREQTQAMTKAYCFIRNTLSARVSKKTKVGMPVEEDIEVRIAFVEVSVNIEGVLESGGTPAFNNSRGKLVYWQIISSSICQETGEFNNVFRNSWTWRNGMMPGAVSLCERKDIHDWKVSHQAAFSKVHSATAYLYQNDSRSFYTSVMKYTHQGIGAEKSTREVVQDSDIRSPHLPLALLAINDEGHEQMPTFWYAGGSHGDEANQKSVNINEYISDVISSGIRNGTRTDLTGGYKRILDQAEPTLVITMPGSFQSMTKVFKTTLLLQKHVYSELLSKFGSVAHLKKDIEEFAEAFQKEMSPNDKNLQVFYEDAVMAAAASGSGSQDVTASHKKAKTDEVVLPPLQYKPDKQDMKDIQFHKEYIYIYILTLKDR